MSAHIHITGTAHIWVRFARSSDNGVVEINNTGATSLRTSRGASEPVTLNAYKTYQYQSNQYSQNGNLFQPAPTGPDPSAVAGFGTGFGGIGLGTTSGGAVGGASTTGVSPISASGIRVDANSSYNSAPPIDLVNVGLNGATAGSIGGGGAVRYLGTAETSPRIQTTDYTRPIFTDEGGTIVPTELAYQSRRAVIIVDLNRFDYNTYLRMENAPRHLANAKKNADSRLDIGRLMSRYMFELWIKFSYHDTPNAAGTDMPPGYYFPRCWLEGPTTDEVGARVQRVRVIWSAYRTHLKDHSWLLYSQNEEDFRDVPDNEP